MTRWFGWLQIQIQGVSLLLMAELRNRAYMRRLRKNRTKLIRKELAIDDTWEAWELLEESQKKEELRQSLRAQQITLAELRTEMDELEHSLTSQRRQIRRFWRKIFSRSGGSHG